MRILLRRLPLLLPFLGLGLVDCRGPAPLARLVSGEDPGAASARAEAAAPIRADGSALAASDDARLLDSWYERQFLGSYRKVGRRNPKWDRGAEEFIRASQAGLLYGPAAASSFDLLARGRTLLVAGCDDPLILFLIARASYAADHDSREASELFERAVSGMHDVAYPRAVAFRAAVRLSQDYDRRDEGTGKRAALAPVELRWWLQSLDDGSFGPDEDVVLVHHLRGDLSSFFSRNRAAIVTALEAHAWIDPWVRLYAAGKRALDDAWDSRGIRYANEVTSEGWKGMEESLSLARKALVASWQARKDRPEAAAMMVFVAMAEPGSSESPRLWFDRAVAAQFDYEPAYGNLINALRTRWGAEPSALAAFAGACAATRRFDTVVPYQAFQAIEQMELDIYDEARPADERTREYLPFPRHRLPPSPYREPATYDTVAAVLERYRREPAQEDWRRFASLQAAIAYKAGRFEDALRFLRDVGGELHPDATDSVSEPMLAARIEAFASAAGASVRRAEDLFEDGRSSEALPLFEVALGQAGRGARPYLAQRIAAATVERDLARGGAVRFLPSAGLPGWNPKLGSWVVEPEGGLLGTSGMRGLMIVSDARVGPDFEIEADVEIASTSNGQFQAAILFGENPSFWTTRWSSFRWKNTAFEGEVAYFSQHFNQPKHVIRREIPLRCRVVVQSWQGSLSAWIDGEEVVRGYVPEWSPPRTPTGQVGFGGYIDDNVYSLRYRAVTLRRLTAAPSPPAKSRS